MTQSYYQNDNLALVQSSGLRYEDSEGTRGTINKTIGGKIFLINLVCCLSTVEYFSKFLTM